LEREDPRRSGQPDQASARPPVTKRWPTEQLVTRVHRDLKRDGGFTLDGRTGRRIRRGLAVCADPGATFAFPLDDWNPVLVAGWLDRHGLHGDIPPRNHLGGWWDRRTGRVALDVVHVMPYTAGAIARAIGRRHHQQAMFDLGARRIVSLLDDGWAPA
jgi:hypothetical protein